MRNFRDVEIACARSGIDDRCDDRRRVVRMPGGWINGSCSVELDPDLIDLLEELGRLAKEAARELIVLGLYGQGELSSGRAAELLGQQREDFIRYASAKGIPCFQMTGEEVRREVDRDKL